MKLGVLVGSIALTAVFAGEMLACSAQSPDAAGDGTMTGDVSESTCATPHEGCPCEETGKLVECGKLKVRVGDEIQCTIGERVCLSSRVWSECTGDQGTRTVQAEATSSLTTKALELTPSRCSKDACDPYCSQYADNPVGLVVAEDAGLRVIDGGLTLKATGNTTLAKCTGLVVTPTSGTELVLTTLTPNASDKLTFKADLLPAGCYASAVHPVWTIDDTRADAMTIASLGVNGFLTAVSPIAGPVVVRAHLGNLVGTATVQVNVDIATRDTGYNASATALDVATTGASESNSLLYPYEGTVLPLGLPAPIPQWTGVPAASAAKVTLRWTNGTSYFKWSVVTAESNALKIVPGTPGVSIPAAPRYPNLPEAAWRGFERSAKGDDAEIAVQRLVGTTRYAEMKRTIHFANSQIKGNVYYQSYGSRLTYNYAGAQDTTGGITFPSGRFGAATLGIEPGALAPKVIAGFSPTSDTSGNNCRVCHTASADGSVLITQKFGGTNGVSEMLTNLTAAAPSATTMTARSDGTYAWPAIFPTGGFLFGNAGVQGSYSAGPAPGGLDGSNASITSSFWSLATGSLGSARAATYRTGGTSPQTITVPSASWSLEAGVPSFSSTGAKIAMQFYDGSVCPAGSASNCTTEEKKVGDKRSIAVMDFNAATTQLSNFRVLNTESAAPCSSLHPSQGCFDVWPTFLPKDTGVLYEREIFHNGSVGGGLSDYGGTRSGCDGSGVCSNDGTKAELWWASLNGAAAPTRLNAANGRTSGGASYLPVGPDAATYCTASGFACASSASCCSGNCNAGRCTGTGTVLLRAVGAVCTAASQCESNRCNSAGRCGCNSNADCAGGSTCTAWSGLCSGGTYAPIPSMSYVPGHNATIEPVLNYEPTMNPTPTKAADGTTDEYYWVVFTSRRMFGNVATGNPWWSDPRHHDLSKSVTTKKLWVAAMKANPAPGTDPSFAAFYLPGQEWVSGNSKAYWVNQACKAGSAIKSSANLCDTTQDCCAGSVCRLDSPLTSPPTRHCATAGTCATEEQACSTTSDCCTGFLCSNGKCADVPAMDEYASSATFTRDYSNACPAGHRLQWSTFEYQGTFPAGTSMVVRARTADKLADGGTPSLAAAPAITVGTATATTTGWTFLPTPAKSLDALFVASGATSRDLLRIELELKPSADQKSAPIVSDWRVNVDCKPNE